LDRPAWHVFRSVLTALADACAGTAIVQEAFVDAEMRRACRKAELLDAQVPAREPGD
jgi:hypothetical protein